MKNIVWPNKFNTKLGVLLGGFSIFGLVTNSIKFGIASSLLLALQWYDRFLEIAIGWARLPLEEFINSLLLFLNIEISIHSHWKHVFIIMGVYFVRDSYTRMTFEKKQYLSFVFLLLTGLLLNLLSSVISGSLEPLVGFRYDLIIGIVPIVGLFIYDLIERNWSVSRRYTKNGFKQINLPTKRVYRFYMLRVIERLVYGSIIIATVSFIGQFHTKTIKNPGTLGFLVTVFALSFYWIFGRASLNYKLNSWKDKEYPLIIRLMKNSGTTHLGMMMLGTFFWLFIFIILNSGLSVLNL